MRQKFAALLAAVLLLSGCTGGTEGQSAASAGAVSEHESASQPEENSIPGSWSVPDGWTVSEKYSSPEKVFYLEEGHENDAQPDNISIEVGTNRYHVDDHAQFRDAIVRQLMMQTQGLDAELTGDGTFTEQDYILYVFTITEEDVTTTQYYIVGDQQYCLVHLTNFTGSAQAVEAARSIADSFVWTESE